MQDIPLEQAIECLLEQVQKKEEFEEIHLEEANGRILAEDIMAPIDQPPFDRSPLDGYAIRAEDSQNATKEQPVVLKVIGEVCAGSYFNETVSEKEAVRIMTGAPIPKGCDCVLRQEDTNYGETEVQIYKALKPYSNYCYAGEDMKKGQLVLGKGERLNAIMQGILASLGMTKVKVRKRIRAAIICTGDELTMPGQPLMPGKIYNSNGMMIRQRGLELGIDMEPIVFCGDDVRKAAQLVAEKSKQVDLVITTGGVSVGKKDILHEVIEVLKGERLFWRVKIQPGTPILAFKYEGRLVISLSGNPFAALANFELLVRPVLAKLQESHDLCMTQKEAILQDTFQKKSPKRRFIRAYYEEGRVFLNHNNHSSGALYTMSKCNCLIEIPAGTEGVEAGKRVNVLLL